MPGSIPNIITKDVILKAPLDRVWRAVSTADEFGSWFGVRFDGPFVAGQPLTGVITPTTVDPQVAASQKPYEGTPFTFEVAEIVPMQRISFRWHPFAIDKDRDYSAEPMTLITFALEAIDGGVHLTLSESGFDGIPLDRRAKAFEMNDGGWTAQMHLIEGYLKGIGLAR